jgi:outer membrane biosynthesis protein TonB
LESIHRLQEEGFTKKTSFLPVLVDLSVMSMDFPLEMARHFKTKLTDLEAKRVGAKSLGIATKVYNDEIERIEKVLPQISDIIQKIKNSLLANFADENRKESDLKKLIATIKTNTSKNPVTEPNKETETQIKEEKDTENIPKESQEKAQKQTVAKKAQQSSQESKEIQNTSTEKQLVVKKAKKQLEENKTQDVFAATPQRQSDEASTSYNDIPDYDPQAPLFYARLVNLQEEMDGLAEGNTRSLALKRMILIKSA